MNAMINAKNLKYEYTRTAEKDGKMVTESFLALDDISLQIEEGSFVAVLGHNGSGKSTFAKNINALITPTAGTLWVNGYDIEKEEFLWDVRQSAGMVFQNPDNQIVATIVEEDVAFGPENLGVEPSAIRKRVDSILDAMGMSSFKKSAPSKLSGGQKQRIAISGVLAMKPKCIVLDEPTAMLDPEGRKDVIKTIIRLNKEEKITILLITHYMDEVVDADKVFVIDKGKVIIEGTPKEIFVNVDTLKNVGLDVPQVTELAHNLRKQGIDIKADCIRVEEMVDEICRLKSIT